MPGATEPSRDASQTGDERRSGTSYLLTAHTIRSQTEKILASKLFQNSDRLRRFLRFAVEEAIQGRADELKEYVIATKVFDRRENFDSRLDSIVRVEANKLRSKLKEYYENEGAADSILIDVPRGGYAACFQVRAQETLGPISIPKVVRRKPIAIYIAVVSTFLILGIALAVAWHAPPRAAPPVTRVVLGLPADEHLSTNFQPALAFSHDGKRLLYVASHGDQTHLYIRRMDEFEATVIPGTEDASGPFFSLDDEWAAFFAGNKLKKIALRGGRPQILCDVAGGRGAVWLPDGDIIFATGSAPGFGLSRISPGGSPKPITRPDPAKGEAGHRWPEILPDGKAVIFSIWTGGDFDAARIGVLSLETGKYRVLLEGGSNARYSPTGHLIFHRAGGLIAVPFDPVHLALKGQPYPVLQGVAADGRSGAAHFSLSSRGTLAYVPGAELPADSSLLWVDRKGNTRPATPSRRDYFFPRCSPDGKQLAVRLNKDIWLYRIADQTFSRLTFEAGMHNYPIWTPDGARVTFSANQGGPFNLFWKPADGSSPEERLTTSSNPQIPSSWSPDGKWLVFDEAHPSTGSDIWLLSQASGKPRPLIQSAYDEAGGTFSPDGKWLAYTSNESGRYQVYVQAFAPSETSTLRWQVSNDGGTEPVWARSGREIFYRNGDQLMSVPVSTGSTFHTGKPQRLFDGHYEAYSLTTSYDVAADDKALLMVKAGEPMTGPARFHMVLNWSEELNGRPVSGK